MTDLKFKILKLLYETYPLRELSKMDIIHSISENPIHIANALKELKSRKLISQLTCSDVFKLEPSGADLFEQIQEEREEASKQEEQQSFENKMSVASLLVSVVTFLAGVLIEHFANIIPFLITVFKKLIHILTP